MNNIQRLGNTLSGRMKKTANAAVPVSIELGVINSNLSLTPDSIDADIAQGEYLICSGLDLEDGDRVLIAWAGNEPVVIAVVTES